MDLASLIQSAQGGQAYANLGQQFGLSPQQVEAAVQNLSPALAGGLKNALQNPASIGAIFSHLTDATHTAAYQNGGAAQSNTTASAGGAIVAQTIGGDDAAAQVAANASNATGIRPDVLQQMLPVLASLAVGGLSASMHGQGLGGIVGQLGQIARQNEGALGGILAGGAAQGQPAGQGGLGGMLMGMVGGFLQRGANANAQTVPGAQTTPNAQAMPGGLDPAMVQSALSTLTSMLGSRS